MVDLDTDAPNGAPPPPGDAKLPSTPSHDGGVEGGSVAFSSSSKETAGSSWDQPLTIESDDEAVELISTPCGDANPDRRIRKLCLMIQKDMTPYGLEVLIFCQETVLKDCPKARSGGAALAAACVLQVPQETLVEWMRDAEKLFASEVPIAWLDATRPETFRKWLDVARRRALALVPRDAAGDAQLADQMCERGGDGAGALVVVGQAPPADGLLLPEAQAHLRGGRSHARRRDAADLGVAVGGARVQGHL